MKYEHGWRSGSRTLRTCESLAFVVLLALACAACGKSGGGGTSSRPAAPSAPAATTPAGIPKADMLSGLCYSPFTKDSPSSGATVTPEFITGQVEAIAPYTKGIRTFVSQGVGTDIAGIASSRGLYVAAGCDIEQDPARNEAEVNALVDLVRAGKADLAVVGEETLYFNYVSEAQLIEYMKRLKAAGAKVTTSDTWGEYISHPNVIAQCDVILANMFPYWENVSIDKAVPYLANSYRKVKAAAHGKQVLVETGWPSSGEQKGQAVASPANARAFLVSFRDWARAHNVDYYYFEAFDEPWKASHEGQVGAHWGIWDQDGNLKPEMAGVFGAGR
jgi:exo-beta-1,3-glucanase (GH17 family)